MHIHSLPVGRDDGWPEWLGRVDGQEFLCDAVYCTRRNIEVTGPDKSKQWGCGPLLMGDSVRHPAAVDASGGTANQVSRASPAASMNLTVALMAS